MSPKWELICELGLYTRWQVTSEVLSKCCRHKPSALDFEKKKLEFGPRHGFIRCVKSVVVS